MGYFFSEKIRSAIDLNGALKVTNGLGILKIKLFPYRSNKKRKIVLISCINSINSVMRHGCPLCTTTTQFRM